MELGKTQGYEDSESMSEPVMAGIASVAAPRAARPAFKRLLIRNKLQGFANLLAFDNWAALTFCRLFDRRTGCTVYRRQGLEILVDHLGGDENGTRQCIVSGMYRAFLPYLRVQQPARVLDLGANGGGFPLMLKLEGIQLAQVVCVEMNPVTFSRLAFNMATNLGSIAVAINAAVTGGTTDAVVTLEGNRGCTGERLDPVSPATGVTVPTSTITELYENQFQDGQFMDICKIDIEGAEYDALADTPDHILSKIGNLFIEFHDRERTPAVVDRLRSLNFSEITAPWRQPAATEVHVFRNDAYLG
jgi:FkbM family methyltransferase